MKPSTGLLFSGSIDKDPRPPFSSALGASNQPAWTSIVFHQPVSGAAIYCAKLKADVAAVPTMTPSIIPSSATPSITPTKTPSSAPGQGFYYQADIKKEQTAGANGNFQMLINTNGTASYKWSLDLSNLALSSTLTNGGCTLDYIKTYGLKCKVYKTYSYLNLPIISLY